MSNAVSLTPPLEEYLLAVSVNEPAVLRRLREETASYPQAGMQISPDQGRFFQFLVHALGINQAIEVGVFTGYSALAVALAMPAAGRIIACDVNEEWTSVACRYWYEAGVSNKIDLRLAPALHTLDQLIAEGRENTFDFAFIDADKTNYLNYYERTLRLVRRGGVIAVDNVLWGGSVIDAKDNDSDTVAIREFNARIGQDRRVFISMLAIRDGITLAYKM